jgi:hypothetical protein
MFLEFIAACVKDQVEVGDGASQAPMVFVEPIRECREYFRAELCVFSHVWSLYGT